MSRCNPYGWENAGGPNPAGGLLSDSHTVDESKRWHCGADATHRYRWECSHDNLPPGMDMAAGGIRITRLEAGHRTGEPFGLCDRHAVLLGQRVGRQPVPCPRCVARGPDHRCWLLLRMVS